MVKWGGDLQHENAPEKVQELHVVIMSSWTRIHSKVLLGDCSDILYPIGNFHGHIIGVSVDHLMKHGTSPTGGTQI